MFDDWVYFRLKGKLRKLAEEWDNERLQMIAAKDAFVRDVTKTRKRFPSWCDVPSSGQLYAIEGDHTKFPGWKAVPRGVGYRGRTQMMVPDRRTKIGREMSRRMDALVVPRESRVLKPLKCDTEYFIEPKGGVTGLYLIRPRVLKYTGKWFLLHPTGKVNHPEAVPIKRWQFEKARALEEEQQSSSEAGQRAAS